MRRVLPLLLYLPAVIAALACVAPVADDPSGSVVAPFGGIDALFQAGVLEWSARHWHHPSTWVDAPIFFPVTGTIGMMDGLLGQAILLWPTRLFVDSLALQYNLALLGSLLLAGGAAAALWRAGGGPWRWGGIAALALVGSPYTLSQLGHLNQLPPPALIAALAALLVGAEKAAKRERAWPWWWAMHLALIAQAAWGWYGFAFAVIAVPAATLAWLAVDHRRVDWLRVDKGTLGPAAVMLLGVFLLSAPQRDLGSRYDDFSRDDRTVRLGSADIQDVVNTGVYRAGPDDWLGRDDETPRPWADRNRRAVNPGWVALTLAVVGWSLRGRLTFRQRRAGAVLLTVGIVGLVLSFGDSVGVPGSDRRVSLPLAWLRSIAPPFRGIRFAWRFSFLFTLAVAWWAAAGYGLTLDALRGRVRRGVFAVGAPVLLLFVSLPAGVPSLELWPDAGDAPVSARLQHAPRIPAGAVFTAPAPAVEYDEDHAETRLWLRALELARPVTGGVTGWVPPEIRILRDRMLGCEQGVHDPLLLLVHVREAGCTTVELVLRPEDERVAFWRDALMRFGARRVAMLPRAGFESWLLPTIGAE